jgi:hypothetical protein
MSNATYDLSSVVLLENVVAKMVADQASGASKFTGGSTPAAIAAAGTAAVGAAAVGAATPAGRFTATYGTTGVATNVNETIAGLRDRIQNNIITPLDKLPR